MAKAQYLIINGPNLNMLGQREPEVYGKQTLEEIVELTENKLKSYPVELEWFQSNIEGEIVGKIQAFAQSEASGLIINPAAYSHTSVAILDALKLVNKPIVEVHLSNTHHREEFRSVKLTAKASTIIMEGLGAISYYLAVLSQLDD